VAVVERVTLKLDVDTDTSSLLKATAQMKAFERAAKSNDRSLNNMGRSMNRANSRFDKLGRTFRRVGQTVSRFFAMLTKFSFIAYAGQVAVLTTALLGAKLAMATGRVAAQGYSIALRGVASAALAAATAVAVAAASMRQFQEAQLSPFTGGVGGAAMRSRSVSPMLRGLMGSEVTQQAVRGLAKSGVHVSQQNAVLSELFRLSGGDSKQMTSLISAINGDPGTFKEAVGKSAAGNVSAERAGDLQGQELVKVLAGGGLTSLTGFANLDNLMGQTVIGTLKTEMQSVLSVFADTGEGLLGPTRETIRLLGSVLTNFAQRSVPLIMKFGDMVLGSNGLASGMQKMSNSLFRMMKNTLPTLEGFVGRMSDMASSTRMFFRRMGNAMRPLESGAEVLMSVFGEIFGGMGGNGVLDRFNRTLTENASSFEAFGESIGNVFRAFFAGSGGGDSMVSVVDRMTEAFNQFADDVVPQLKSFANTMKELFLNAMPPLFSMLSNILGMITPIFSGVVNMANSVPGGGSDIANLLLLGSLFAGKSRFGRVGRQNAKKGIPFMAPIGLGRFGQRIAPGNMGGGDFFRTLGANRLGHGRMANMSPRMAGAAGGVIAAGGIAGGLFLANALSDANRTGDVSAFNVAQGFGGGAAAGLAMGGLPGAAVGAAAGGAGTILMGRAAQRRRTANLNRFTNENLISSTLSAEEQFANFSDTMRNLEDVAKNNDMSADELRERLELLKPAMDDIYQQIEAKVLPRVKMLTDVFGFAADEADQLARNLSNADFSDFLARQFNNFATDATAGFGFAARFEGTSANKTQLRNAQAGLESSIFSQFGGNLDVAAKTEEGRRQIEALFNNIVSQSMLVEGQTGIGAEMTAIAMLEKIFGTSEFVTELESGNADLLRTDERIANLIGEGNQSLEDIGKILDFAFGGGAEAQLRAELGTEFDERVGGQYRGAMEGYGVAREKYINDRINYQMTSMLQVQSPISVRVSGVLTPDAVQRIQAIARAAAAKIESDVAEIANDATDGNGFSEDDGGFRAVAGDVLDIAGNAPGAIGTVATVANAGADAAEAVWGWVSG
jgi:hypothetical protein